MVGNPKQGSRSIWQTTLIVGSVLLILTCCGMPWLYRGTSVDINKFHPKTGVTMQEIEAEYGPPADVKQHNGGAVWYYNSDRWGWGSPWLGSSSTRMDG